MKKLLLLGMVCSIGISLFAQNHPVITKKLRSHYVKMDYQETTYPEFTKSPGIVDYYKDDFVDENIIGGTRYDLQTSRSCPTRIHLFDNGSVGAVWTRGIDDNGFPDRGTGYNYFDGNTWGDPPSERIESIRTGWPSYTPYGENGELVVSHDYTVGSLYYLIREEKGTGNWIENEFLGPENTPISWNRVNTSGVGNSVIQLLYKTWPEATGSLYQGMNGAILYSRSSDGGETWDMQHELLEGMTAEEYYGFRLDRYDWAAPKGDNIAFLVGDRWFDLFLMKSNNGGDTWTKTVIWEHPYPLFDHTYATDTFYCADGAHHLAFDSQNKIHVVFGINYNCADETGATWWWPEVGGIVYWNEDMPTFTNNLNALNPYGHPDSELVEDISLIGWTQDVNGNGQIDITNWGGLYDVGRSSHPQIIIDEMDYKYVVFTSVTETYDNGTLNYRHLWARGSWGDDVWGDFVHLTDGLEHLFHECVYPSVSPNTDDNFYLIYQADSEPGYSISGTMHPTTDNSLYVMKVLKSDLIPVDIEEFIAPITENNVSQNYPNPFNGITYVNVKVNKSCTLSLKITNLTGQVVYSSPDRKINSGSTRFEISANHFSPGVYFYSVKADGTIISKKMIVE